MTKSGTGTLTLSGANAYTGVTTLSAGTLSVAIIGNGGVAGNLGQATNAAANLIFDGGTLAYTGATASTDRSFTINTGKTATIDVVTNDLTMSGAATNTNGALTKAGAGALILTGTNLNTGITTITAGRLQIGNGGTSGALGAGNIVDNAALRFDRSDAIAIANAISGTGTLEQAGTGTLSMNTANTYSGGTTVNAGILQIGHANALGYNRSNCTDRLGMPDGHFPDDPGLGFQRQQILSILARDAGFDPGLFLQSGRRYEPDIRDNAGTFHLLYIPLKLGLLPGLHEHVNRGTDRVGKLLIALDRLANRAPGRRIIGKT
ncbi:MAG: autotransporter-associated beta strand repeat-containing protein [Candidatus Omnitrophica bacterium]|nr:autotransporter-associated beta strand repeat-containing protein [Candidatus Omnitrophota bacterium]